MNSSNFLAPCIKGQKLIVPGRLLRILYLDELIPTLLAYCNFTYYLNTYHISYYANRPDESGTANLRKNSGFNLVLEGEAGIPYHSEDIHKLTLIKNNNRILMYVDERKIIDWVDDGKKYGPVLNDGRLGLRQMAPAYFSYSNLRVWELEGK